MNNYVIKYNELSAEDFIYLWESVWDEAPSIDQVKLAMENTLFRVSVFDGEKINLKISLKDKETTKGLIMKCI